MTIRNINTLILIDPMSHSLQSYILTIGILSESFIELVYDISDSGIGDHGPNGINTFTTQHVCNYICHSLKLTALRLFKEEVQSIDKDGADDDE